MLTLTEPVSLSAVAKRIDLYIYGFVRVAFAGYSVAFGVRKHCDDFFFLVCSSFGLFCVCVCLIFGLAHQINACIGTTAFL